MRGWGASTVEAMFMGSAMVATSVGITARVLSAMGLLDAPTARIILGAAVIDDILGLLVLAVVSSAAAGEVRLAEIATTAALSLGFTAFVTLVGARVVNRVSPRIRGLRAGHAFYVFGLLLCFGLSVAAAYIGVAAIIGAFLAGMTLAEASEGNETMHKQTSGVTEFLVPFFLVNIGMQLDLSVFRDPSVVALAALVTLIAMLTKFVGCGAGAWGMGGWRAAQVGVGMMPRGEVGIVVAQLGLSLALITQATYGVVLFMSVATTLLAPPLLKRLYAGEPAARAEVGPPDAGGIVAEEDLSRIG